ncbi:uncharacterized protein LOC6524999 [Drosophila yakuba]|uniref:Mab-21-like HhH/H2TH-like domain-containing protein n=1 Tax=Drosophila yakuba TaxID=7245 RepID=B4PXW1_DROYA|nr:uncharacterized protein LOC6524999 [Drosophila yakuba]EDX01947.1 uncharacterized protein Dyak_GE15954 [Drosophila yakuba]
MGCSWSRSEQVDSSATPNALQAGIPAHRLQRRRRREEKHHRQLQKLQKRNARKRRRKRGAGFGSAVSGGPISGRSGSINRRNISAKSHPDLALQLRLLGGSNGSTATECVSALYARTLEQQREEFQRTVEQRTLHQLDRELHTFLLNQLLLGVQFFGHFEAEMAVIDAQIAARRRNCSAEKLAEHSLLQSSAIDAAVARNLLFKPPSSKATPQLLQKPVTYVVFENVDVARPHDANYDTVASLCKVLLETDYYQTTPCPSELVNLMEMTRWMGYVRLKLRDQLPHPQAHTSSSSSSPLPASSDEECIYTDVGSSPSSGYSSGDYDYVYLARLNTPRPLEELRFGREFNFRRNVLPESCIRRLANCLPPWMEQTDDEESSSSAASSGDEDDKDQASIDNRRYPPAGYETVEVLRQCHVEQLQQCYLSSQQFMLYFGEVLRHHLANQLGISQSQLAACSYRGCSVYTAREELVPAIHVPNFWPDCAFEFWMRARPRLTNIHTAEQFQWPTEQMKKRIRSMGFHVVPVGYAPKRSRNPFRELEWRIVFPQAEQFLERHCLTPMQLKVFQLMKLLVKTFVDESSSSSSSSSLSSDQSPGALLEQLRAHMFWQCEQHSNDWPEEFLGERLVRFIRSFDACLAKKHLSDYFIERRNLFEHVPEDTLMKLRSIMAGIAEQPLLHVIQALRNLQHAPEFYPQLEYKRLLANLFSQDYLELHGRGKFSRPRQGFPALENRDENNGGQQVEEKKAERGEITDAKGLLGLAQHQERSRGKLRRKTQLLRATTQQRQISEAEQRRCSLDSLDRQLLLARSNPESSRSQKAAKPQLNNGLEILRRSNLVELLLDHSLAMLACATRFGNRTHAQLYLEQGQRLCRLYQHLGCSQQAQHFVHELQSAASDMERMCGSHIPSIAGGSPTAEDESPPAPRKSIKFQEHVVQIHSPDPLTMPKHMPHLENHQLNGILRAHHQEEETNAIESLPEEDSKSALLREIESRIDGKPTAQRDREPMDPPKVDNPEPQTEEESKSEETAKEESLLSLNGILQRFPIDRDTLQVLGSKTEQLVLKVTPSEAKREELKEILKRNTQKLKGAFN